MKDRLSGEASRTGGSVSSSLLFISGLLIAPAVIVQDNLIIKLLQTLLFILLALISKRRILLLGSLIFFLTTLILNLLNPLGRVLVMVGPFPITEEAMTSGLAKGLTILCLIYLSRFCVRQDLRLPGPAGRYLSKTFFYLNCFLEEKKSINRKEIIKSLDGILENIYNRKKYKPMIDQVKSTPLGIFLLAILFSLNWGLVFFP